MTAGLNRRQLAVLALWVAGLAAIVLFPPWLAVTNWADGHVDWDPVGRHFLLTPPGPELAGDLEAIVAARRRAGASLYFGPDFYVVNKKGLIVPIAVVSGVMATGLVLFRGRQPT